MQVTTNKKDIDKTLKFNEVIQKRKRQYARMSVQISEHEIINELLDEIRDVLRESK